MWTQVQQTMIDAANRMITSIAGFLPGLLALLLTLIVALIAAAAARQLVLRALRGLEFDGRAHQLGLNILAELTPSKSPSVFIARTIYWTVIVVGLLIGLTALDASMPFRFALSVFQYLPHLIAAVIILLVGTVAAQFLSRAMLISAVNLQIRSARLLSAAVRWLVLIVAAAMALEQLGIGQQILLLAFGIVFGGIVFATALAVGLGAKDAVSRAIERQLNELKGTKDPLDHV